MLSSEIKNSHSPQELPSQFLGKAIVEYSLDDPAHLIWLHCATILLETLQIVPNGDI